MRFFRAILCWVRHVPEWEATPVYNHEGEFCHWRVRCKLCGRPITN
jgi:hypothetical protein